MMGTLKQERRAAITAEKFRLANEEKQNKAKEARDQRQEQDRLNSVREVDKAKQAHTRLHNKLVSDMNLYGDPSNV